MSCRYRGETSGRDICVCIVRPCLGSDCYLLQNSYHQRQDKYKQCYLPDHTAIKTIIVMAPIRIISQLVREFQMLMKLTPETALYQGVKFLNKLVYLNKLDLLLPLQI